jgi:NADPH-dependent 2,4-dienoyl-CoA reductase/sulfur reductase-like enzyme
MKYMIIGAGAAGLSAATAIRKFDPKGNITVLSNEPFKPYSLCSLPSVLLGEIKETKLARFDFKWWKSNKIGLKLKKEVTRVNPNNKTVEFQYGRPLKYDKLLIATGSKPFIPPLPGNDLHGIFTFNSLNDYKQIKRWLKNIGDKPKAVIIGGGFIGLETAITLHQLGVEVTVIEMLDGVLPRMVDSDISKLVIKKLKTKGVKVKTGCKVTALEGTTKVQAVTTTKGRMNAEMVVWCIGVRPNIEFIKGSGIKTKSGVVVNPKMQTSKPNIYAAGDIIESYDLISERSSIHANWPNAIENGYIAGANMAGHEIEYNGTININTINVFELPVVSIGLTSNEHQERYGKNWRVTTRKFGKTKTQFLNKAMFANGKLTGFQSIGWPTNIGWILSKLRTGDEIPDNESVTKSLLNDSLKFKVESIKRGTESGEKNLP